MPLEQRVTERSGDNRASVSLAAEMQEPPTLPARCTLVDWSASKQALEKRQHHPRDPRPEEGLAPEPRFIVLYITAWVLLYSRLYFIASVPAYSPSPNQIRGPGLPATGVSRNNSNMWLVRDAAATKRRRPLHVAARGSAPGGCATPAEHERASPRGQVVFNLGQGWQQRTPFVSSI